MLKRVGAWILLLGFVFLLINITLIRKFYWKESIVVYAVIAVIYFLVFLMKKDKIY